MLLILGTTMTVFLPGFLFIMIFLLGRLFFNLINNKNNQLIKHRGMISSFNLKKVLKKKKKLKHNIYLSHFFSKNLDIATHAYSNGKFSTSFQLIFFFFGQLIIYAIN